MCIAVHNFVVKWNILIGRRTAVRSKLIGGTFTMSKTENKKGFASYEITRPGKRKISAMKVIGVILMISLAMSVVYSLVRLLIAPSEIPEDGRRTLLKSDYLLMLIQCMLGLIVMMLPSILARKWKIVLPNVICILYYVFLYCAIFLGEVFSFYYIIPHWDSILHAFSGAMLGALGFVLVDFLNKDTHTKVSLSPFFISLFAFSFALAIGALWEVYEFSFDALLGLNMQKHTTAEGGQLVGTAALTDTMKDIIIDALAAFAVSVIGFFQNTLARKPKEKAESLEKQHESKSSKS